MDKKTKKNQIKKALSWVCLVVLVAVLAAMPLLAGSAETSEGPVASILSAQAVYSDIDTRLIGGGTLIAEDAVEVTVPEAVKLTEYYVSNGDMVSQGDPIARVDRVTVMSAITQVQETLEYLAEEIEAESENTPEESVSTQVSGTVKAVYAQAGDSVADVMLEHGALAVLSLDGMMAVDVERNTDLTAGDTVCVVFEDGGEVDGRVESNLEGVLTVTIEDENYSIGEQVKVTTEDGDRIGVGTLYIHSQWNAVAYSGTVKAVSIKEGKTVSAGSTMITLKDTGNTAKYQQLINQHQEYEKMMLELFVMYQTEMITAPTDGMISGVDENGVFMLSDAGSWTLTQLANGPQNDETYYINTIGQVQSTTDGISLKMYPGEVEVPNEDYMAFSWTTAPDDTWVESVYYGSACVFERSEGSWVPATVILPGDILLFARGESGIVWIIKAGYVDLSGSDSENSGSGEVPDSSGQPDEGEQGSGSGESGDNSGDIGSGEATTPTVPSGGTQSGSQSMTGGASFGSMGGTTEEAYEVYSLGTVAIASVTPRNSLTLEISIDELDIGSLYPGQMAMVTVEALYGETFDAVISQIGNTGSSNGGNAKFTVELTLECNENMLNGMTASAFITLDTEVNVLTVPVAALNERGVVTYVYTSFDEETQTLGDPVTVTAGVSDGENVQILSGLEEGTTIYYAYYDTLTLENSTSAGRSLPFGNG